MNKQNIPAVPDENRLEELLEKIQPVPSRNFHQQMQEVARKRDERKLSPNINYLKSTAAFLLVILAALFVTPQGRAWAQEIVQFFKRISSTTILLSEEEKEEMFVTPEPYELPLVIVLPSTLLPEMAAIPECKSSGIASSYACQIAYAESKLGFDLKEFPFQPESWELESLNFDPTRKTAFLSYRIGSSYSMPSQLLFIQSLGDKPRTFNHPLESVPADRVEVVQIGPHPVEYVKGGFGISNDNSKLLWMDSDDQQRLAWSDGTRWYYMQLFTNTPEGRSIGRDELINLAASLVDKPTDIVKPLNPDFLYSISDAETISGLDLKAPTLLPLGMEFSSAQYLPKSHQVLLRYGAGDEFVIHQWEGKPANFEDLASASGTSYEIVKVGGKNAFYSFSSGFNPYSFLWWSEGKMNYQIYYYSYLSTDGGVLTKEKMIAIAESMNDLEAVRGNTFKPYEYVTIYEQTLGFDVKEFPSTPSGWGFTGVSAYAQPACIHLSYAAQKEAGWLSLRQCRTDTAGPFGQYDIPRRAIERVQIGENEGRYIHGFWETDESGKSVWNPDLPFRTLRWQEKGLWLELILSGESALLYDKEDLISYAGSLR
jgi:hypothetical protein